MTADIRVGRLEPVAEDGARRAAGVRERLPAVPSDPAGWEDACREARAHTSPLPRALVDRIVARQDELGAGPRAAAAARALAEPGTLCVVTGQHPGLLGGLLLSFHKAAGALHLSHALDGGPGRRVVPVFWSASEDHDVDEANRCLLLDRQGQPRRLGLALEADGRSLMHVPVEVAAADALLRDAAELLPDTDRARDVLARCRLEAPTDFGTWSNRVLCRLLGDAGVVVLDPEAWLPFAGPAFADLLDRRRAVGVALLSAARELERAGLPAPLAVEGGDGYVPLFLRGRPRGPRQRLHETGPDRLAARELGSRSAAEVRAALLADPRLGSGDVVGRVFVQNRLLPVLAYVGGPTELAYHVQIRAAYEAVGEPFPLAIARPTAIWVDAKTRRTADAFGLTLGEVLAEGPQEKAPWGTQLPGGLDLALERTRKAYELEADLPGTLAPLSQGGGQGPDAIARAWRGVRDAWRRGEDQIRTAFTRDAGTHAARWTRMQALLFPRGRPQERGLSALSVVARHGDALFRQGLATLDPLLPGSYLIESP